MSLGPDRDFVHANFETAGTHKVRLLLENSGYNWEIAQWAIAWLAEKDQTAAQDQERIMAEQVEIARSAAGAAWVSADEARASNAISRSANTLAIVAICVSLLAIVAAAFAAGIQIYAQLAT